MNRFLNLALCGLASFCILSGCNDKVDHVDRGVSIDNINHVVNVSQVAPLTESERNQTLSEESGEMHDLAMKAIEGIFRMDKSLVIEDQKALIAFIKGPKPKGLKDEEWEERVNVILNVLRSQNSGVPELTDTLIQMAKESDSNVLRMYSLQHLSLWYDKEPSFEKRREILCYLNELGEGSDFAGAAVSFLNEISKSHADDVDRDRIEQMVLNLVNDPSTGKSVRISALQVASDRKMKELLPIVRAIAEDEKESITLRKAAIYNIGKIGGVEDISFLERLGESNFNLKSATKPAISTLGNKNQ